jgi:hypothetical protein
MPLAIQPQEMTFNTISVRDFERILAVFIFAGPRPFPPKAK